MYKAKTLYDASTQLNMSEEKVRARIEQGELIGGFDEFFGGGQFVVWLPVTPAEEFKTEVVIAESAKKKML